MSEPTVAVVPLPSGGSRRRRLVPLAMAASILALTACAGLPPSSPVRQAKAPQSYATQRSFDAPAAEWPGDGWWRAFGDPQLNSLIEEALGSSPDLAEAEARVRKSEAQAHLAQAANLPKLNADGAVEEMKQSYNNGIPPAFTPHGYNDSGRVALDFSWELDFWGRNRAAVAAAVSEARAARAEAAQARLMLASSVAGAYADLARLYAERDVAEHSVSLRQETLDLARQRLANGLDTRQEIDQAEGEPPRARVELAALDEQIIDTRHRLAALLGAGPDRGLSISRPSAVTLKPFGLPDRLALDLIGRRPDVAAARWRAEAAERRVHEARAAFYPNVNLAAYIGVEGLHLRDLTKAESDIGSAGPALSLPILDGGALRASLRGAWADRDAAVAAYDGAVTEALRQVADAAAGKRTLSSQLLEAHAALASDEGAWRLAKQRYAGGLSTYQSVLSAEQSALNQKRAVVDLENRALVLDVALVRALGGGFASP